MLKKLISTAILSSVIGSVSANPELGYMTLNTDQHRFFNATIAIDALPAELADKKLKVKLGSITDFFRHDIEYNKQVSSLRFKVTRDSNGKPLIRVRSTREITGEQLQAVVKLYVGRQKIYGIYDFQLAPGKKERHVALNLLNSDHKPVEKPLFVAKEVKHAEISSDQQYQVMAGKTISQIAIELLPQYPEASSWQELMGQVVSINPNAFVDGDINQLKSDAVLNLPARENSLQVSSAGSDQPVTFETDAPVNELATRAAADKIEQPLQQKAPQIRAKEPEEQQALPVNQEEPQTLASVTPPETNVSVSQEQKTDKALPTDTTTAFEAKPTEIYESRSYRVSKGESISLIAIKIHPEYPEQEHWTGVMKELITLNPDAFIDGDINQLRPETELRLPEVASNKASEELHAQDTVFSSMESDSNIYQVENGESISEIAMRLVSEYPETDQWQAVMSRLVALNPEAFIGGDVNKLLSNALLILPGRNDFEVEAENQELPEATFADVNEQAAENMDEPSPHSPQAEVISSAEGRHQYQVSQGESVSTIAMKLAQDYPAAYGWKGIMELLVTLNPEAFIHGDTDRLRSDAILTLPTKEYFEVAAENYQQQANADSPDDGLNQAGTYKVSEGESISVIAVKLLPDYPQTRDWKVVMNSLILLNPGAFIEGNAERLRSDALLTIPSQGDLEIEAENQELAESLIPDSSFNDDQPADKKKGN